MSAQSLDRVVVIVLCIFIYSFVVPPLLFTERYVIVKSLFLRGLAMTTLCALYSFRLQCEGLFGDNGLYPLSSSLRTIEKFRAENKDSFHILSPEYAIRGILSLVSEKFQTKGKYSTTLQDCLRFDMAAALVGIVWPHPVIFVYLYVSYYAYKRIGGPFLNFQWDSLLLETLFVSIPLSLANSPWMDHICIWMCRGVLFRLMFGSGIVKANGRDPSWFKDFSAMNYHFLTQPLPNRLGRLIALYAPKSWFVIMTISLLVLEVFFPLVSLLGIPVVNGVVALGYMGLMMSIALSGYYGFFNILSMVLSLVLISDSMIVSCLKRMVAPSMLQDILNFSFPQTYLSDRRGQAYDPFDSHTTVWGAMGQLFCIFINTPLFLAISLTGFLAMVRLLERCYIIRPASNDADPRDVNVQPTHGPHLLTDRVWAVYHKLSAFHDYMMTVFYVGNHYGLFANMTKFRDELIIEVAINPNGGQETASLTPTEYDQLTWHPIRFRYKPDHVDTAPKSVSPFFHMPRLDWCLWFLALKQDPKLYPRWFRNFLLCIVEADSSVLQLLSPATITLFQTELKHTPVSGSDSANVDELAERRGGDKLLLRVSLWRFSYAGESFRVDRSRAQVGKYWSATKMAVMVEPSGHNELLRNYEQFAGKYCGPKPTVEKAQDIILRTLSKFGVRRKAKHSIGEEEPMDFE
jgi:hypothetical protein